MIHFKRINGKYEIVYKGETTTKIFANTLKEAMEILKHVLEYKNRVAISKTI